MTDPILDALKTGAKTNMKPTDQDEDDRLQRVGRWSVLLMFVALFAAHLVARYLPLEP